MRNPFQKSGLKNVGWHRSASFYLKGFVYLGLILSVQFTIAGLVYLNTREQVLFSGLNSDDVAEVSEFLKDRGVTYRIVDSGSSVLIRGDVVRLQEEFKSSEWRKTQYRDKVTGSKNELPIIAANHDPRRLDAIRKELEKLLSKGSEKISWARVGFPYEEKAALEEGEGKKGAAVFVGTGGHSLPPVDVERIQWVVANSFAGLKPSDVTVLDEVGHELTHELQD